MIAKRVSVRQSASLELSRRARGRELYRLESTFIIYFLVVALQ